MIKETKTILSRIIGENIEILIVLKDDDLIVMADSSQLELVLINLATNAMDAMQDGGSLIIRTERVELDNKFIKTHGYGKPGPYAFLSIEDSGQGIDEETRARIFEPFFTTKEVGKGTGLGLSIVFGIIRQHDGYINLSSEPGRGTTFNLYLPLIKSTVKEEKETIFPTSKKGTETILLTEDDVLVRELIREVLTGAGYIVVDAKDGEDALRVFNENKKNIQLLILDVVMPKKNGKEVYEKIKATNPDIKAIFISGYDANIFYKKGILEEGFNFIQKPVLPDELLKKVREVLDKGSIK
jgi:CheY-like chemotaxis protein